MIFLRLRKVKGAEEIIANSSYVINNPKKYIGKYSELFGNDNPIQVEIGMGKGNFIIGKALKNPDINFIGIEKFDSVLVRAIEKLDGLNIPNLKIIKDDALFIDEFFKKEIDCIYLNFSDPWPKKRHTNRRLTSPIFLKKYDSIFFCTCRIIMKTDNRHLFEYSLKSYTDYGYKLESLSLNLYDDDVSDNVQTEYEKKFVLKNMIIYYCEVVK